MRVIGESKAVDLSKKLTVELSLHEIAVMTISLGAISTDTYNIGIPRIVNPELVSKLTAGDGCSDTDYPYNVFKELKSVLVAEGVVED